MQRELVEKNSSSDSPSEKMSKSKQKVKVSMYRFFEDMKAIGETPITSSKIIDTK